jgi:hypothetical protein
MAGDVDGTVYLNVHVGGILRYRDDDPVWRDTMDIDADVHEVIAHPDMPGTALAATARGVAISRDGADSWTFHTDGLLQRARWACRPDVDGRSILPRQAQGQLAVHFIAVTPLFIVEAARLTDV